MISVFGPISNKVIPVLLIILAGITFYSCTYYHTETSPCESKIPATVSFSSDVLPIFRSDCSTSGCHSGSNPPGNLNLEDQVAYNDLIKPGKGYINTGNPASSLLYNQMTTGIKIMPPSGKIDDCKIQLILTWIQQGAKNN